MPDISSALRFSVPVRTRRLAPVTSPAGLASTSALIAAAISCMVMSYSTRLADGTSTMVSGAATPRIVVRVTPTSNSRATNSSAKSPSCSGPIAPVITTSVTRSRQAPRRTTGSSASSGKVAIKSTAVCTSSAAWAISQPGSNSSLTEALPSRLVADELSTPSTNRSAGSITWTIPASTSSGPAPSQETLTVTSSTMTSGKNCARMLGIATTPRANRTTKRRFAAVRCRVK